MRGIKFRAWSRKHTQFYYSDDEGYVLKEYDGILWLVEDTDYYSPSFQRETKVYYKIGIAEEYVGQKDKNGKEIYECDFYKQSFEDGHVVGKIVFETHWFCLRESYCMVHKGIKFTGEVIGNPYENPELMEGRDEKTNTKKA